MNLRKDHCRDPRGRPRTVKTSPLPSRAPAPPGPPRGPIDPGGERRARGPDDPSPEGRRRAGRRTHPGAARAKEHDRSGRPARPRPRPGGARATTSRARAAATTERLSATDISALASMKNVAKCDTWCELQNPVNHRVFERKLRPRPSGRGHACLGVTPRVAPRHHGADAEIGPPCPPARRAEDRAVGRRRATTGGLRREPSIGTKSSRARGENGESPTTPTWKGTPRWEGARGPRDAAPPSHRDPRSGGATRRV